MSIATQKDFAQFTADDVLDAWEKAMIEGLGPGRTFEPDILKRDGLIATLFKGTVEAEMTRRVAAGKPRFDAMAFRASTRVATDLGRICAILADATTDKVVRSDVFQRAKDLTDLHESCRGVANPAAGGGPFC